MRSRGVLRACDFLHTYAAFGLQASYRVLAGFIGVVDNCPVTKRTAISNGRWRELQLFCSL